ncbi:hypothetical protein [Raoultella ornithinolytica]|uniref:hypothetical protein n=1 Tax=Raoultella ornithinolytica TaxID=54291 RepID=UPI0021B03990|nr:hypothetical protein [Raoultella ornithinolytica]MCT4737229.1 hypothetical protein [Raoultella ornithinolytica]
MNKKRHSTGAMSPEPESGNALSCGHERALEGSLDRLFDSVSAVRHVLHARMASLTAKTPPSSLSGLATPLRSEPAHAAEQEAYVLGLDALAHLQRQLAGLSVAEGTLPLPWAMQGILDSFAATCRLALPVQQQIRARLEQRAQRPGVTSSFPWTQACQTESDGVSYRVIFEGEGAPVHAHEQIMARVSGWAENGPWLGPWTVPAVQTLRLTAMHPALAAVLRTLCVGGRVLVCLPVSVLYGAAADAPLICGGGQQLMLDIDVVALPSPDAGQRH